ncbi:MAG TPA: copper resistance protein CopC, partial [Glaciihabitans sp.]|nr:copper resistance protein CopC [Glaciihabitans sp.]
MIAAKFLSPRRFVALAAASVVISAGCVLGFAAPASAHNYLVSSTPAEGQTLTELPDVFEITTNEALLATAGTGGFGLVIMDESGRFYGDGCVDISGATMSTAASLGEAGEYTAIWK